MNSKFFFKESDYDPDGSFYYKDIFRT